MENIALKLDIEQYLRTHDLRLSSDFALCPIPEFAEKKTRRIDSLATERNIKHTVSFKHIPTNTRLICCYVPRLHRVKRAIGRLCKINPKWKQIKLMNSTDRSNPIFEPFVSFTPKFVTEAPTAKRRKVQLEVYASLFIMLFERKDDIASVPSSSSLPIDHSSSSSSSLPPLPIDHSSSSSSSSSLPLLPMSASASIPPPILPPIVAAIVSSRVLPPLRAAAVSRSLRPSGVSDMFSRMFDYE